MIDNAIKVLEERMKVVENTVNCAADFASYCELIDAFKCEKASLRVCIVSLLGWKTRLQRAAETNLPFL